jgi:Ser/Thr protein kinase RdoA (MazF antagonist)
MDLADRVATALHTDEVDELVGGHQSRVFRVTPRGGPPMVAKVLDASMVDRTDLDVRLDVIAALADLDPRVCRPLLVGGQRVIELSAHGEEHHLVCYELALGRELDPARPVDAERMGAALSELHLSMSRLPATSLGLVGALRAVPADEALADGGHQLLHGDFGASNLREVDGVVRIFDLDDCGDGPPAFDVANALYMVLFDATTHGASATYEAFRRPFLDGYLGGPGPQPSEESVARFVDLRVRALTSWLDDLDRAPIGIRTASPAWRATLRSFASAYRPTAP